MVIDNFVTFALPTTIFFTVFCLYLIYQEHEERKEQRLKEKRIKTT